MNAIVGLTNLVLDRGPGEEELEDLEERPASAEHLLGIEDDAPDVSMTEAGELVLDGSPSSHRAPWSPPEAALSAT